MDSHIKIAGQMVQTELTGLVGVFNKFAEGAANNVVAGPARFWAKQVGERAEALSKSDEACLPSEIVRAQHCLVDTQEAIRRQDAGALKELVGNPNCLWDDWLHLKARTASAAETTRVQIANLSRPAFPGVKA